MILKLAIGIIIYKPPITLLERLKLSCSQGYKVYLFDNSPEDSLIRNFLTDDPETSRFIEYITIGTNAGLGVGLARLCSKAYDDGNDALLFFDQDTVYTSLTLNYIYSFSLRNITRMKPYSSIGFLSSDREPCLAETDSIVDVVLSMNSGSLFLLENVKTMNWHNTKNFVDCVDYDFSLDSLLHCYKLGTHLFTPGFDHSSEQGNRHFMILGKVYPMRPYPLSRIWDFVKTANKLIFRSFFHGQFLFFIAITSSYIKYLFIQIYVRIRLLLEGNK